VSVNGLYTVAPVEAGDGPDAEWVDLRGLDRMFSIRRSHAYLLIQEGAIRSVVLRRPGTIKGRRLVELRSVRQLLSKQAEGIDPRLSKLAREAQIASAKAKREAKEKKAEAA
jgi:hypothetical protein